MSSILGSRLNPYGAPRQPHWKPWITGPLEVVLPAAGLVVSLEEARLHLRWPSVDRTQDAVLLGNLLAAQAFCEQEIAGHRQFLTATYNLPLSNWPWTGVLKLPRPPLQQVSQVTYYDTSYTLQTLANSFYLVQTPWRMPGQFERAPFQVFPPVMPDMRYPITIQFVAGYASPFTVSGSTLTVPSQPAMVNGTSYQLSITGAGAVLPAPLAVNTTYFVVDASGNTCQLSLTSDGEPITLTSEGTSNATFFLGVVPQTIRQAILMTATYWDANRGNIGDEKAMNAVKALLGAEEWGSYA